MKTEFVNWEIAHENDFVREAMEICNTENILDFFETDTEILYVDGTPVLFVEFENEERRVIVFLDGSYNVDENEIIKRLEQFYNESESFSSIDSTRENMDNLKNGVAYRGGKGYIYSLSEYAA